jgi:drug/metabolite transporter (DMT)-like permease
MVIAQIFGCLMNVTTRILEVEGNKGQGLHPFQILFARMGITFFLASLYMWYRKTPHFPFGLPEVRWLLIARGLGGFAGVFGMYYSLLALPLADATVITFLSPSLACWACSILIKEPFPRAEQIGAVVSIAGVIFIAQPASLFRGMGAATPPGSGSDFAPPTNTTMGGADASNYDDVTPTQRLTVSRSSVFWEVPQHIPRFAGSDNEHILSSRSTTSQPYAFWSAA